MPRPLAFPAQDKVRVELSILSGELTNAEAARRAKVSRPRSETGSASSPSAASSRPHGQIILGRMFSRAK